MIIRSIKLENFGLYAGRQCLEPAVRTENSGPITLVGGLNGRGKTSLLEAILLNLYGSRSPFVHERARSYSAYLDSLIHRGVPREEGAAVELELMVPIEEGHTLLRIRRSWKAAAVRVVDRLEIWRDGLEDSHLASNWDTYVENLIPSGISGLFFFDGEKISALAESGGTSESVKAAIRSLLGLDLVDRLIADLNLVIKRHQVLLNDTPGAEEVEGLERELEELYQEKRRLKREIAGIANRVERAQEDLRRKENEYLQLGGTLIQNRERLQQEQRELQEKLAELKARMVALAAGPLPLLLVMPLLKIVQTSAQADEQIRRARTLLPALAARDRKIIEWLRQAGGVDTPAVNLIEEFLRADRAELEAVASRKECFSLSPLAQGQLADLISRGQFTLSNQVNQLLAVYQETQDRLDFVNQHLHYPVDQKAVSEALLKLSETAKHVAELQHQQQRLQKELDSIDYAIHQTEQKRKNALKKILEESETLDDAKRTISLALRSQDTMRTFSRRLAEQKIGRLAEAITMALRDLMQKPDLISDVRIHPETLQISLYDNAGQEVPKERLSSGEKQMLAIAILWGLARASGRELPVIIDTPMGRLDSSHRMNFVTKYLPNASHQVIVLSTDTEIIGATLEPLNNAIGRRYLLHYDDVNKRTFIKEGYFACPKEATA
ncbi:DNA sulphur modification protein DndD [Moorella glycerini]|uniref:Nuclease SbcCD subunit C n=1 Tax=Neomoorella stamsii TaxID=1266720 RepID=A0A9X7P7C2_9FIRM|nr:MULTISPECIES: DNA sulfur modification protein DndD [Moorella]PRR76747.1 chromosome segregation protein [Moorella stamsii]CEP66719.1 DNA sulphur modification protein DndD [Moorella glycerini]